MISDLLGEQGAKLALAVAVVAAALFVLFMMTRLFRRRDTAAFLRGRKNQPRLAVLDTAAVDAKRRLVLVRRDGVEHLLMIGGPVDVVVESGIRTARLPAGGPSVEQEGSVGGPAAEADPSAGTRAPPQTTAASQVEPQAVEKPGDAGAASKPDAESIASGTNARAPAAAPAPHDRETANLPPAASERAADPSRQPVAMNTNADEGRAEAVEALDAARARVFGAADTSERKHPFDDGTETSSTPTGSTPSGRTGDDRRSPSANGMRFEDVLDAEIAGDLSAVRPETDGDDHFIHSVRPANDGPSTPSTAHVPADQRGSDRSLDDEMARLLKEISSKR